MRQLPDSYTVDSAMALVPPRRADASDTSLRSAAFSGSIAGLRFDRAGFGDDPRGGLARDAFYISPYLTCEECNGLVYVDAAALRSRMGLGRLEGDPDSGVRLPLEPLPPCPGCNKTNTFRIGAEDLTSLLAGSAEELARRKRVQRRMAKKIQVSGRPAREAGGERRSHTH
jgi:hypothetical protein